MMASGKSEMKFNKTKKKRMLTTILAVLLITALIIPQVALATDGEQGTVGTAALASDLSGDASLENTGGGGREFSSSRFTFR
jgi:hypothetical protein